MAEHVNLLRSSASAFVQALFGEGEAEAEAPPKAGARGRATGSAFKLNSVGSQFRKQLQARLPAVLAPVPLAGCMQAAHNKLCCPACHACIRRGMLHVGALAA